MPPYSQPQRKALSCRCSSQPDFWDCLSCLSFLHLPMPSPAPTSVHLCVLLDTAPTSLLPHQSPPPIPPLDHWFHLLCSLLSLPDNSFFTWYQNTENLSSALCGLCARVCICVCVGGGGWKAPWKTFVSSKHLVLLWEALAWTSGSEKSPPAKEAGLSYSPDYLTHTLHISRVGSPRSASPSETLLLRPRSHQFLPLGPRLACLGLPVHNLCHGLCSLAS